MIFTTVLISCLVALLGVLQHASFDLLSSLAHLRHPSLSSINAFLQLTGLDMRPTLDTSFLPGVDFAFSQLYAEASLGEGFASTDLNNLNLTLPDLDVFLSASIEDSSSNHSTPELKHEDESSGTAPVWRTLIESAAVVILIVFGHDFCKVICVLWDKRKRHNDELLLGTTRALLRQVALPILCETDTLYNPDTAERFRNTLAPLFTPASIEDIIRECAAQPQAAYVPSTTSTSTPVTFVDTGADVGHLCVFDVLNRRRPSTKATKVKVDVAVVMERRQQRRQHRLREECLRLKALFDDAINEPIMSIYKDDLTRDNASGTDTPSPLTIDLPPGPSALHTTVEYGVAINEEVHKSGYESYHQLRALLVSEGYDLDSSKPTTNINNGDRIRNPRVPDSSSFDLPIHTHSVPSSNNFEDDMDANSALAWDLPLGLLEPDEPAETFIPNHTDAAAKQPCGPLDNDHPLHIRVESDGLSATGEAVHRLRDLLASATSSFALTDTLRPDVGDMESGSVVEESLAVGEG